MDEERIRLERALYITEAREQLKSIYTKVDDASLDLITFYNELVRKIIYLTMDDISISFLDSYVELSKDVDYTNQAHFKAVMMTTFVTNVLQILEASNYLTLLYMNNDIRLEEIEELITQAIQISKENLWGNK